MIPSLKFKTLLMIVSLSVGLAWLYAQESSSDSSDKWTQIQENQKKMLQSLDTVEQNLNFIKIRSMSGGPNKS